MKRTRFQKFPKDSGVYSITSKINNKRYIGSAFDLKRRKQGHLYALRKRQHENPHLQNHVNKYGLDDLQFFILEFCQKEKLIEREQYWYDLIQPEFNICKEARSVMFGRKHTIEAKRKIGEKNKGNIHSEEAKRRMSESLKGKKGKKGPKGFRTVKHYAYVYFFSDFNILRA